MEIIELWFLETWELHLCLSLMIYILIVGWFQNFLVPLVMLAAIPLSLIGIILGSNNCYFHDWFYCTSGCNSTKVGIAD